MNDEAIRDTWQLITHLPPERLNDPYLPLEHLDGSLHYFQLEPIQSGKKRFNKESAVFSKDANFKDLQHTDLLDLRYCIYTAESLDTVTIWAETLLRFCEVRLASLKKRATEKCGSLVDAQLITLHLMAFLLDYGGQTGDLRFLNTALKLADQKWIMDDSTLKRRLRGDENEVSCALLQFRAALVIEHWMAILNGEGTL